MCLASVRIRHHKTECVIMTKTSQCRMSVINCDSDDSSSESDSDNTRIKRQNAIDTTSSSEDSSSSSNPFGYIRYYNPTNETQTETKYESFIDYGEPNKVKVVEEIPKKKSVLMTSTARLELLHKQGSENSEASSVITPKPFGACEDLVHLDVSESGVNQPLIRQSCPTKFVGNKFNATSLTAIYIPPWSNSDTNISCKANFDLEETTSSTHSSSLELPVNTLPLPDKITAELLYNMGDNDNSSLIKPPSMFEEEKPRRRSSIQINPGRCVSSKYLRMSPSRTSYCRCCSHSPRSSDSGMAGSCTLNSPDLNVADLTTSVQDVVNAFGGGITLSEIEARDFESQCPCTSPFGSTPRTSSKPSVSCGNSVRTSVTSSEAYLPAREVMKSKSAGCLAVEVVDNLKEEEEEEEEQPIYKSGLYAHWWLKAKIPANVIRGIYQETRTDVGGGADAPSDA